MLQTFFTNLAFGFSALRRSTKNDVVNSFFNELPEFSRFKAFFEKFHDDFFEVTPNLSTLELLSDMLFGSALRYLSELGDPDGNIKASARMDGASSLTAEIALNKAYTAASLGMASHDVHEFIKSDPSLLHGFSQYPRIIIFGGGYPIKEGAETVGAIGVSGAHYSQDMECAMAGLDAIGAAKA